jgi:hypothetical protein
MRISKFFFALIAALFLTPSLKVLSYRAPSFKCEDTPTIERANKSKAVFLGQVVNIKKVDELEEVKFKVSKSWKYIRGGEATVFNYPHHEAPHYEIGKAYLVFASNYKDRLTTGVCSGTVEVNYAKKDMDQLDKWWRRNKSKRREKLQFTKPNAI